MFLSEQQQHDILLLLLQVSSLCVVPHARLFCQPCLCESISNVTIMNWDLHTLFRRWAHHQHRTSQQISGANLVSSRPCLKSSSATLLFQKHSSNSSIASSNSRFGDSSSMEESSLDCRAAFQFFFRWSRKKGFSLALTAKECRSLKFQLGRKFRSWTHSS